jgi:hypothetical protein
MTLPLSRLRREWPSHLTGALLIALAFVIAMEVLP